MHQQQWLVVIEEMGGSASPPIPNSFNQARTTPAGRWTQGLTLDGKGTGPVPWLGEATGTWKRRLRRGALTSDFPAP